MPNGAHTMLQRTGIAKNTISSSKLVVISPQSRSY